MREGIRAAAEAFEMQQLVEEGEAAGYDEDAHGQGDGAGVVMGIDVDSGTAEEEQARADGSEYDGNAEEEGARADLFENEDNTESELDMGSESNELDGGAGRFDDGSNGSASDVAEAEAEAMDPAEAADEGQEGEGTADQAAATDAGSSPFPSESRKALLEKQFGLWGQYQAADDHGDTVLMLAICRYGLGVDHSSSTLVIRKAYRAAILLCHVDQNPQQTVLADGASKFLNGAVKLATRWAGQSSEEVAAAPFPAEADDFDAEQQAYRERLEVEAVRENAEWCLAAAKEASVLAVDEQAKYLHTVEQAMRLALAAEVAMQGYGTNEDTSAEYIRLYRAWTATMFGGFAEATGHVGRTDLAVTAALLALDDARKVEAALRAQQADQHEEEHQQAAPDEQEPASDEQEPAPDEQDAPNQQADPEQPDEVVPAFLRLMDV